MKLIERINNLFQWVSPILGKRSMAPTGEPYITYAIGYRVKEDDILDYIQYSLENALWTAFARERYEAADHKPEMAPLRFSLLEEHPFLYWRRFPTIESDTDFETGHTIYKITCRARVSNIKIEDDSPSD